MHLTIRHEPVYLQLAAGLHHPAAAPDAAQQPQQRVLSWQLNLPGAVHAYTDAYGNPST
jgi:hypothetical protein